MKKANILIIIPARGSSKGIPRKNLRPLNGKPLLHYSISNALNSGYKPDVFVSTDDDEIAFFAKKSGAEIHLRDSHLADDKATLDPVIFDAYIHIKIKKKKDYELIITLQPTSPLLHVHSLDEAIEVMLNKKEIDTMISAVNDTHLTWGEKGGQFFPNYEKRVNRQFLPPVYKETGGFLITRSNVISDKGRIGKNVQLHILSPKEAIDIDSHEDWQLCEYHLGRKNILFRVSGYPEIGLGHIYNCLLLASEIMNHRVYFLTDKKSGLGYDKIKSSNYEVYMQMHDDIVKDIETLAPDLVINDCLDTDAAYMKILKDKKYKTINIEDLGPGAMQADLVINAIYPEKEKHPGHYYGPEYFCARDEFIFSEPKPLKKKIENVLLTFGGVDPNNLTCKVLDAVYEYCLSNAIQINVVLGLGYKNEASLKAFTKANIVKDVKNISDYMSNADLAFSSAGRTTYELALLGTPSIILAQNEREMTHFFADEKNGFKNLGLGTDVEKDTILKAFIELSENHRARVSMNKLMLQNKIREGKKNVLSLINKIAE